MSVIHNDNCSWSIQNEFKWLYNICIIHVIDCHTASSLSCLVETRNLTIATEENSLFHTYSMKRACNGFTTVDIVTMVYDLTLPRSSSKYIPITTYYFILILLKWNKFKKIIFVFVLFFFLLRFDFYLFRV